MKLQDRIEKFFVMLDGMFPLFEEFNALPMETEEEAQKAIETFLNRFEKHVKEFAAIMKESDEALGKDIESLPLIMGAAKFAELLENCGGKFCMKYIEIVMNCSVLDVKERCQLLKTYFAILLVRGKDFLAQIKVTLVEGAKQFELVIGAQSEPAKAAVE